MQSHKMKCLGSYYYYPRYGINRIIYVISHHKLMLKPTLNFMVSNNT